MSTYYAQGGIENKHKVSKVQTNVVQEWTCCPWPGSKQYRLSSAVQVKRLSEILRLMQSQGVDDWTMARSYTALAENYKL